MKNVRNDFPVLKDGKIVYFDSACVSLKPVQVVEAMNKYYYEFPACAGRSMHSLGEKATNAVDDSRKKVAKFFNAKKSSEIIFTRNTTEGMNLVSKSMNLRGKTVITTDKEHNSNLIPWLRLKEQGVIDYKIIGSNADNSFSIENLKSALEKGNVALVSVNHSSNLDGMSVPLKEVVKLAHDYNAKVLVDAAQSAPHLPVDVRKLDVDFLACSGHKMLGPSGIGMLYGKEENLEELQPFMLGGDTVKESWQDRYVLEDIPARFEAGLQNYSGIIGFGAATDYLNKIGMDEIHEHDIKMNNKLTESLKSLPLKIIGNPNPELRSGVLSFYSDKVDSHEIALLLNSHKIMVRSGAFCVHSWFNKHKIKGAVRFSSYLYNNDEDCDKVIDFFHRSLKGIFH